MFRTVWYNITFPRGANYTFSPLPCPFTIKINKILTHSGAAATSASFAVGCLPGCYQREYKPKIKSKEKVILNDDYQQKESKRQVRLVTCTSIIELAMRVADAETAEI